MLRLRFWQPADLPFLCAAAAQVAWDILPPDDRSRAMPHAVAQSAQADLLLTLQSPGGTAVVAEAAGRPVGFLLVTVSPNERTGLPFGYMADIYVAPDYRGRGLARELDRVGGEYLRRLGLTEAVQWTHAHNAAGQALARRNGFEPWGVMMAKELPRPAG